ncbi:MAG: 2,3-bisphosphoglycerate-dependent phosphoglycerate mutase [Candidatus Pacebacteria bacterium]|nr:2,3-bisphosphoglycerate-dependent phosphoglycerate mutase [Candidatus Paceibacterota bacterium]MDD3970198.1 2,3-bisphosphoglycerate-dependent phosphoglycerate mutase [Candidatus Paceibacterota bacterium]
MKSLENKIIIIRHGESVWNKENIFTGWIDIGLSKLGITQAKNAGKLLKEKGFNFDIAYTSELKRATNTLDLILEEMKENIPIKNSWRLNERHYGLLQGKNKDTMRKVYGEDKVQEWRRGYDAKPPEDEDGMSESLKDTEERVLPYWEEEIKPKIKNNKIIISAHGNSIRALIKIISPEEEIERIEVPVGIPMVYEFNEKLKPLKRYFLSDDNLD